MSNPKKILVVAPHPDDEVLGCGGTIQKYARAGVQVDLCVVTKAYTPEWSQEFIDGRPKEVRRAADILGITDIHFLDFPTVKLDQVPQGQLNDALAAVLKKVQPDTLLIPHRGDLNRDHRLVHEAALVAARPFPEQSVRRVLAYETLSETEWGVAPFNPNVYEDIRDTLKDKCEAMEVYSSELKPFPHPRSLEGIEVLAKKRGSEVCMPAAEAFMLVREIAS